MKYPQTFTFKDFFSLTVLSQNYIVRQKTNLRKRFSVSLGYIQRLNELINLKFDQEFKVKNQNFYKFEVYKFFLSLNVPSQNGCQPDPYFNLYMLVKLRV